jgi:hypothetical protein
MAQVPSLTSTRMSSWASDRAMIVKDRPCRRWPGFSSAISSSWRTCRCPCSARLWPSRSRQGSLHTVSSATASIMTCRPSSLRVATRPSRLTRRSRPQITSGLTHRSAATRQTRRRGRPGDAADPALRAACQREPTMATTTGDMSVAVATHPPSRARIVWAQSGGVVRSRLGIAVGGPGGFAGGRTGRA